MRRTFIHTTIPSSSMPALQELEGGQSEDAVSFSFDCLTTTTSSSTMNMTVCATGLRSSTTCLPFRACACALRACGEDRKHRVDADLQVETYSRNSRIGSDGILSRTCTIQPSCAGISQIENMPPFMQVPRREARRLGTATHSKHSKHSDHYDSQLPTPTLTPTPELGGAAACMLPLLCTVCWG
jgi:hypothetical protein